jgi:endonuclease YncB( thermonuclease family)
MYRVAALCLAGLCLGALPAARLHAQTVTGPAQVVDGDTVQVAGRQVRLLHIDAPESGQSCGALPCGTEATRHLARLVQGGDVTCQASATDAYGRLLGVCTRDGIDLGRRMVADGHAMVFRRYGDTYDAEETAARRDRLGLWRAADPTPPWDFRARRWAGSAASAPRPGCPIKGNINATGERIYHTPYSQYYDRTRISPARGERWFCSESEARAEGWRAARGS